MAGPLSTVLEEAHDKHGASAATTRRVLNGITDPRYRALIQHYSAEYSDPTQLASKVLEHENRGDLTLPKAKPSASPRPLVSAEALSRAVVAGTPRTRVPSPLPGYIEKAKAGIKEPGLITRILAGGRGKVGTRLPRPQVAPSARAREERKPGPTPMGTLREMATRETVAEPTAAEPEGLQIRNNVGDVIATIPQSVVQRAQELHVALNPTSPFFGLLGVPTTGDLVEKLRRWSEGDTEVVLEPTLWERIKGAPREVVRGGVYTLLHGINPELSAAEIVPAENNLAFSLADIILRFGVARKVFGADVPGGRVVPATAARAALPGLPGAAAARYAGAAAETVPSFAAYGALAPEPGEGPVAAPARGAVEGLAFAVPVGIGEAAWAGLRGAMPSILKAVRYRVYGEPRANLQQVLKLYNQLEQGGALIYPDLSDPMMPRLAPGATKEQQGLYKDFVNAAWRFRQAEQGMPLRRGEIPPQITPTVAKPVRGELPARAGVEVARPRKPPTPAEAEAAAREVAAKTKAPEVPRGAVAPPEAPTPVAAPERPAARPTEAPEADIELARRFLNEGGPESAAMLQRRFKWGYMRAARALEAAKVERPTARPTPAPAEVVEAPRAREPAPERAPEAGITSEDATRIWDRHRREVRAEPGNIDRTSSQERAEIARRANAEVRAAGGVSAAPVVREPGALEAPPAGREMDYVYDSTRGGWVERGVAAKPPEAAGEPVPPPEARPVAAPERPAAIPTEERFRRLSSIEAKANRKAYEPLTDSEVAEMATLGDVYAKGPRKGQLTDSGQATLSELSILAEQKRLAEGAAFDARPPAAPERPVGKPTVADKGVVEAPGPREVAPEVARAQPVAEVPKPSPEVAELGEPLQATFDRGRQLAVEKFRGEEGGARNYDQVIAGVNQMLAARGRPDLDPREIASRWHYPLASVDPKMPAERIVASLEAALGQAPPEGYTLERITGRRHEGPFYYAEHYTSKAKGENAANVLREFEAWVGRDWEPDRNKLESDWADLKEKVADVRALKPESKVVDSVEKTTNAIREGIDVRVRTLSKARQEIEAEIEAQKAARAPAGVSDRLQELKPTTAYKTGWAGNYASPTSPILTDRYMMLRRDALRPKSAERLSEKFEGPGSGVKDSVIKTMWDRSVRDADRDAELVGVLPAGGPAGPSRSVAYIVERGGEGVVTVDSDLFNLAKSQTKADTFRVSAEARKPVVLYRGKNAVAVVMPIELEKPLAIDVARARQRMAAGYPEPAPEVVAPPAAEPAKPPAVAAEPPKPTLRHGGPFIEAVGDYLRGGREIDHAVKSASEQLTLVATRTAAAETSVSFRAARDWQSRLKESELEDIGAAVEGIGNLRIEGDTAQAVNARLTPEGRAVLREYRTAQEQARQGVNDYLREMDQEDYIKFLDNYLPHYYAGKPSALRAARGRFLRESPNAKQRKLPTLQEARDYGLTPITQNVAKLHRMWAEINWRVATNRRFVYDLKGTTTADGEPVMMKAADAPAEWVYFDHPAIARVYGHKTAEGKVILWRGGVKVHPDVAPAVRMMLQEPFSGSWVRGMEMFNAFAKKSALSMTLFHHGALTESSQAVLARAVNPLRGILVVGEKHPVTGKRIIAQRPHRIGVDIMQEGGEWLRDPIQHGLQIERGVVDIPITRISRALAGAEAKTRNIPVLRDATRVARQFNEWWDRALWERYHSGLKTFAYYDLVGEGLRREGPGTKANRSASEIKEIVAGYLNDAFGGQEWASKFWFSPRGQQAARWGFLAPDWTLSNIEIFRKTLSSDPVRRRLQFRYWRNLILTITGSAAAAQYGIKQTFGRNDEDMPEWFWDNPEGSRDAAIDVTPIYRQLPWVDPETDKARRYVRFGKQAREVGRWVMNPFEEARVKSSPAVQVVVEQFWDSSGGGFDMPWTEEDVLLKQLPGRTKAIAGKFVPFSLRGNNFAFTAPMRKGMTPWKTGKALEKALEAYADPTPYEAIARQPDYVEKLDTLVADILDAAEKNGIDPKKAMQYATARVRGNYYKQFFRAMDNKDTSGMNDSAEAILRLHGGVDNLLRSAKSRGIELTPEQEDLLKRIVKTKAEELDIPPPSTRPGRPSRPQRRVSR